MLTKLLTHILHFTGCRKYFLLLLLFLSGAAYAQVEPDTTKPRILNIDTLLQISPEVQVVDQNTDDSLAQARKPKVDLADKITYRADDSCFVDWNTRKAFLYNNAYVKYEDIELTAAYIEIDFDNNTIYAKGLPDSNGVIQGNPVFKDKDGESEFVEITVNMDTRKGLVKGVSKQEGEIYTQAELGKKMPDNTMYVSQGHFTTCNLPHPHYSIRYKKAKVIPSDKIITGPIYMEIEDVPIPLILPFGFFPNKRGRANGLLIPSYGYSESRGYYLINGGYYTGLGERMDLALRGDIYSKGSWALKAHSNYNVRYKFNGYFNFEYAHNRYGETDLGKGFYNEDKSYFIRWQHRQDAKANPYSSFTANVNMGSVEHNQMNSYNANDYLTNTFKSSVAYSTRLWGNYNLTLNADQSQNTKTHVVSLTLPSASFSTPRYTILDGSKSAVKKDRAFKGVNLSVRANAKNTLDTYDSLFTKTQFDDFRNGVDISVPINANFSYGVINWNNSANYKQKIYFEAISDKYYQDTIISGSDTLLPMTVTEMSTGFYAPFDISFSSGFDTRIYGMITYTKGPVKAIRHVITPTMNFSYRPDMGSQHYREYEDQYGQIVDYSIYAESVYGGPSKGRSGRINFNLANNLEMKVRNRKDTANPEKKIKIIDNLDLSSSYDFFAEEYKIAPLVLNVRSSIFRGLSIRFNAAWDFYGVDSNGVRTNELVWDQSNHKQLFRKESGLARFDLSYSLNGDKLKRKGNYDSDMGSQEELDDINRNSDYYVDFNIPWNLRFSYSLEYRGGWNSAYNRYAGDTMYNHTLNFSGDINITAKWKVGFRSGYDFMRQQITYTSFDIYRDLHCWEMSFNWIPIGPRQSYNLTIRVKSPLLQDLKLNKKRDWRDY